MSILDDISGAAYDIMAGRVGDGFLPVAKNFNIAANHNHPIRNSRFDVYSYTTRVAVVNKNGDNEWDVLVHRDAFHHSVTTSKHVRCFVSAMAGRVDWDALYKACNKACDDETNGKQFINVSQFTY